MGIQSTSTLGLHLDAAFSEKPGFNLACTVNSGYTGIPPYWVYPVNNYQISVVTTAHDLLQKFIMCSAILAVYLNSIRYCQ